MSQESEPVKFLEGINIVEIPYADLVGGKNFSNSIKAAFGFEGLGILTVSDVPGLAEKRSKCLPLGYTFANLPEEIKQKTVHKESFYSFGWSHGKEMLKKGVPDFSKGSYYFNPEYDVPFEDIELQKKYPAFCHPNIWPTEDLPELQPTCKDLGQLVVQVGKLIALQCDNFIHSIFPDYPETKLHDIISTCKVNKGRLLNYFPLNEAYLGDSMEQGKSIEEIADNWCGWHNDHGSLTGLVPPIYLNDKGKEIPCPDNQAGLYIRSRSGDLVRVAIPKHCLGFQIGETSQIHSGGILQATPHAVVGPSKEKGRGVSRISMAVFMEPRWDGLLNSPKDSKLEQILEGSSTKYLPVGVPLLGTRFKPGMTFGEFSEATFKSYY